jgi:hypothetical protein
MADDAPRSPVRHLKAHLLRRSGEDSERALRRRPLWSGQENLRQNRSHIGSSNRKNWRRLDALSFDDAAWRLHRDHMSEE